jgi:uncharacterized protein (TIRG00374 family)
MPVLKKIWRPLLAIALIGILIKKGPFDIQQLKFILSQPMMIAFGLTLFLIQNFVFAARWKLFVDLTLPISMKLAAKLHLIGMFFNFFIPGGVGGDIVKALELSKQNGSARSQTLSTVMSDRIFGLFAMITFSTLFLALEYTHKPEVFVGKLLILSLLIFTGMLFALLVLPHIFNKISDFLGGKNAKIIILLDKFINSLSFTFKTFKNYKIQLYSLLFSAVTQTMGIFFMYSVVKAVGITPPSFLIFFSLCCFGFVAAALPIMPGGIGVGQYAFYALFANISVELGKATITAITVLQIFTLIIALFGGLIFALSPGAKKDILNYESELTENQS